MMLDLLIHGEGSGRSSIASLAQRHASDPAEEVVNVLSADADCWIVYHCISQSDVDAAVPWPHSINCPDSWSHPYNAPHQIGDPHPRTFGAFTRFLEQYVVNSDRLACSVACETAVYLRRALRRRGLGTLLKRHIIEKCRNLGYHHLVAKILANNEPSIAYNMRLGYELVGVQREIGWLDGHWQDVAILQLVLDDVPPDAAEPC